jgi:amidohydrolase
MKLSSVAPIAASLTLALFGFEARAADPRGGERLVASIAGHDPWLQTAVKRVSKDVEALYVDLHQHPELSRHEEKTAATFAKRLGALGFEVTTGVGGTGVVGLLKNGQGPTLMLRTELDALPVEEKTGLSYASHAFATDDSGDKVPVMHACGHDVHIAAMIGAVGILANARDRWHGTIMVVGQPAEETLVGARAMLDDGLFARFPRPDFAFGLHVLNKLPVGRIGYRPGVEQASSDVIRVVVHGRGGHGSAPQTTIDPVLIAARIVVALQSIVSRENDPLDPAVVTVGAMRAGTRANIIPDEASLDVNVRALRPEVRKKVVAAIERIVKAEAAAAGAPEAPTLSVVCGTEPVINDPELTRRLSGALAQSLGSENVVEIPPMMSSEDFSAYGRAGIRSAKFYMGAAEPSAFERAEKTGVPLPSNHSSLFAPDRVHTLDAYAFALSVVAIELLGR